MKSKSFAWLTIVLVILVVLTIIFATFVNKRASYRPIIFQATSIGSQGLISDVRIFGFYSKEDCSGVNYAIHAPFDSITTNSHFGYSVTLNKKIHVSPLAAYSYLQPLGVSPDSLANVHSMKIEFLSYDKKVTSYFPAQHGQAACVVINCRSDTGCSPVDSGINYFTFN